MCSKEQPEKSFNLGREILSYLLDHPDAQDTLEGIVQWWMLERSIQFHTAQIREALEELVASGLLVQDKSKKLYQMNRKRHKEIQQLVQNDKKSKKRNTRSLL